MKNFDSRTYSINDFREWNLRKELVLQPKFQRRSVWSDKARSYLIDTIVRGKPIPKIFIRQEIEPKTKKTIREVVDGQQRLRTVFSYLEDGFKLNKTHSDEHGGRHYSELPESVQTGILKYELSVDLLLDAPDKEVLDIFSRLNSYAVKLNAQELRNASYFGAFKTTVYRLSIEYVSFWEANKIFTDSQILRMAEAELVSEVVIAMMDGIKGRKVIDGYYKKYDDDFKERISLTKNFRKTMDVIGAITNGNIPHTPFKSPVLFYSLFCSIYHHLNGLPKLQATRKPFKEHHYSKIWTALESVEEVLKRDTPKESEAQFVNSMKRHTTDEPVRVSRTEFLAKLIGQAI
jgi:uncharacterized protein with ParB-like and HNH nuclease domain